MNKLPDIAVLLRKFAKGELDNEEKDALNALLLEQPELAEEIKFTGALIRATEKYERQRLLTVIKNANADDGDPELVQNKEALPPANRETGRRLVMLSANWIKWAATAAVLLIAISGYWWISTNNDQFKDFQKSAYVSAEIPGLLTKGENNALLSQAVRSYESGNYDESLAMAMNVTATDSFYLYALYLKGHNYYKLGEYEDALNSLNAVDKQQSDTVGYKEIRNRDNLYWTKILVLLARYLQDKQAPQKAALERDVEQFLSTGNNADTTYYNKAKTLQAMLNK